MAETPIGPKSFARQVKAPSSQARPSTSGQGGRGGIEGGGGGGLTAFAPGGQFAQQANINSEEITSLMKVIQTRLEPRMQRLQQEQAVFGAMKVGAGMKLKEVVDKQPGFSKIFGDTYVVEGARQFAVVTQHQEMMNQIARDMPELRKLAPAEMQQEIMKRIGSLETGDATADALLQTQAITSMPSVSKLYTAENIAWTQSEMKRNQFNAVKATGDKFLTLSESLKAGTITLEEFQQQTNQEMAGIIQPVDGQTDESYRENVAAAAQSFVQSGNYHAVNALKSTGVFNALEPEMQNRVNAFLEQGKTAAVATWAEKNQEELAQMNIAYRRAMASGDIDGAKNIIRAANGRIILETGVDYQYFDEAKSVTEMQMAVDTNKAKVQEAEIKSNFAVEAGLIQAEAATLLGRTDEESRQRFAELLVRAENLNTRYRTESGDAAAEYIEMGSLAKTGAVAITQGGLQRDKDLAQAAKERRTEEDKAAQAAIVDKATETSVRMGNGSKIVGLDGQTEDQRNIAFQRVFDTQPDDKSKIALLASNYASSEEVNKGVANRLQQPVRLAINGGRWNDALVPTLQFYTQMIATPGGGAAAEAYYGSAQAKILRNFMAIRANVADPAIAWEMAANAPPSMPKLDKETTERITGAVDKYMQPGWWARHMGGQVELSPVGNSIVRDHLTRQVAMIQEGNPNISDEQAVGIAMGSFKNTGGEYAGRYAWYRDPSQSPDIGTIIGKACKPGEADLRYDRNKFGQTIDTLISTQMKERGIDYNPDGVTIIPGDDFGNDTLFTIIVTGEKGDQPITAPIQLTLGELNVLYRNKLVPPAAAPSTTVPAMPMPQPFGRNTN